MLVPVQPPDPAFEGRVRASFVQQKVMGLIGARLAKIAPGEVAIELKYRADLTQQDGFLHAGVVSTIADSAGGYAAYTLMPAESRVLSTEYKMHFLAPAQGERFVATGKVVKSGRTLTICELRVESVDGPRRTLCAYGTQTLICMQ